MIRLALCDDNEKFMEVLKAKVEQYCSENNRNIKLTIFTDSYNLAEQIEKGFLFDAYILDIEMKNYTGLELASMIGERSDTARILILSAYAMYAVKACGMNILRYVLKDRVESELSRALDYLFTSLDKLQNQSTYLISNQNRYQKILQDEIIYIYKSQKNVMIVLSSGRELKERLTLMEAYKKLNNPGMVFLDRGIIINLFHVKEVTANRVVMDNDAEIPTSQLHTAELKKKLNGYWRNLI